MKSKFRQAAVCATAIVATLLAAQSASAQSSAPAEATQDADAANGAGVQDIVVTAQKREQRLQDVPVAITALSTSSLITNRITTVRDLDSISPNLTVRQVSGAGGLPTLSMRGVVSLGSSLGVDRGIALYLDGVYLGNAFASVFELGDVQRIEVLRGPQGTLFGRNSTGGAISIVSADPKGEFGVRQTVSYGNYNQFRSVTHLDTPRYGDLSASFNFVHSERRGDIRNLGGGTTWDLTSVGAGRYTSPNHLGGNNTEAASANILLDNATVRAIYRFDWSDSIATTPGFGIIYASPFVQSLFAAQPNPANLTPFSHTRPDAVNNAGALPFRTKTMGHNLTLSSTLTDNLSVKNIASYRKSRFNAPLTQIDGAGGLINPGPAALPAIALLVGAPAATTVGAPLFIQATLASGKDSQFLEELQFNYNSRLLTLTVGGLYFRQKQERGSIGEPGVGLGQARSASYQVYPGFMIPFAGKPNGYGAIRSNVRILSTALYGQAEFHILDNLDLVGGARYTHDDKEGQDNSIVSAATPATSVTPRNAFPIDYSKGKLTYNVGYNYKPDSDVLIYGKYATGFISGGFFASVAYDPETAKSWEGGIKADWFDRKLRTNLSLFTVKYSGLQLTANGPSVGIANSALSQVVVNAGTARAKGFELETTLRPVSPLTIGASLGYTHFRYLQIDPRIVAGVSAFQVHERPKWTGTLSGQYESDPLWGDANLVLRVDGNYKSKHNAVSGVPLASPTNALLFGITPAELTRFVDAQRIKGYWLVNGRVALQKIDFGGAKGTVALWGRNIFNSKQVSYSASFVSLINADYERARTYGVDLTIEF